MKSNATRSILIACASIPFGFRCQGLSEVRKLPTKNPRSWTFHASPEIVSRCASGISHDIYADRWGAKVGDYEAVRLIKGGQRQLHNIYLSNDRSRTPTPKIHSEVYLLHSCPLPLYAEWHLRIIPEASGQTRIDIKTWGKFVVHNYSCFYIAHAFGCGIPAEYSTIEEYRILKSIGDCVGEQGMPDVIVPTGPIPDPATCG
jgi:hypothetical protein